jgi:hypothetical protein
MNALVYLGRFDELRRRLDEHIEDAVDRGDLYAEVSFTTGFPNLAWLADDDPEAARARTEQAMRKWSKQGFHLEHFYEALADVHVDLYQGDCVQALDRVRTLVVALGRSLLRRFQSIRIIVAFLEARACLGLAMKDGAQKEPMLAQATSCARRIRAEGTAWGDPIAVWLLAGVEAARGNAEGAKRGAREAAQAFEAKDMLLYARLARLGEARLAGDEAAVRAAEEPLRTHGIANPGRMLALFAPSFA